MLHPCQSPGASESFFPGASHFPMETSETAENSFAVINRAMARASSRVKPDAWTIMAPSNIAATTDSGLRAAICSRFGACDSALAFSWQAAQCA